MKRIRELREEKGMSQQQLSLELNITQAAISKYESDISEPDFSTIRQLTKIFNVSSDYLLEITDDKINFSPFGLTEDDREVLYGYKRLNKVQKQKFQAYLKGLLRE